MCGGTAPPVSTWMRPKGLSPRVRGNLRAGYDVTGVDRSIPACAGEPLIGFNAVMQSEVYPRVCGGTPRSGTAPMPTRGLSPRVRGNPPVSGESGHAIRSIPACAGEPAAEGTPAGRPQVYPRVCGGTPHWTPSATSSSGLSPRVRGNRANPTPVDDPPGSIPACAGEPRCQTPAPHPATVYPRVCGGTPRHFDSNPCYRICQGNNAAPPTTSYQIRASAGHIRLRPDFPTTPHPPDGRQPRFIPLLSCAVRSPANAPTASASVPSIGECPIPPCHSLSPAQTALRRRSPADYSPIN